MTQPSHKFRYDVAAVINQGQRDFQEDSIIVDFPLGTELGYVVLADGMGGHTNGDIASKIVVTEISRELKLQSGDARYFSRNVVDILLEATHFANDCVKKRAMAGPGASGMGSTLLAPVLIRDRLYWISIGDSPLFLFRNGKMTRLNEDHSLAPQIDRMAGFGLMTEETRRNHPDRNCLSSCLFGQKINLIDCPRAPLKLRNGDIVVVASDGLQFLPDEQIETVLAGNAGKPSKEIADILMQMLDKLDDPYQDNVAFSVIRYNPDAAQIAQPAPKTKYRNGFFKVARAAKAIPIEAHGPYRNHFFFCGASVSGGDSR